MKINEGGGNISACLSGRGFDVYVPHFHDARIVALLCFSDDRYHHDVVSSEFQCRASFKYFENQEHLLPQ